MTDLLTRVHGLMSSVQKLLDDLSANDSSATIQYGGYIRGISQELLSVAHELDLRESTWMEPCFDFWSIENLEPFQPPAEDSTGTESDEFGSQVSQLELDKITPHTDLPHPRPGRSCEERGSSQVSGALQSLLKTALHIDRGVQRFEECFQSWYKHDERMTHMSSILLLRRRQPSESVAERILMTLAAISLAQDYATFEKLNGWTPRCQLLLDGFSSGQLHSGKQNHLSNFAAALSIRDHKRLTLALGFGLKLQIVRELARDSRFGEGLALHFGVEYRSISRLSYRRLYELNLFVKANDGSHPISESTRKWSQWFTYRQQDYDAKYRRFPIANGQVRVLST